MTPENDCLFCNATFQEQFFLQQTEASRKNDEALDKIQKRLTILTAGVTALVITLVARDILQLSDIQNLKNIANIGAGICQGYLQSF